MVGFYALYAAQVKWYWPKLLDLEYVEMRDNAMHGVGHNSLHDTEEKALKKLIEWCQIILSKKKEVLLLKESVIESQKKKSKEEIEIDF